MAVHADMARSATMSPELKGWLSKEVYPHLSHDMVFGQLPNYTKAQYSETRYSDCPRCRKAKQFVMISGRPLGTCNACSAVVTWWSYLRFDHSDAEAIAKIAALAGVPPLDTDDD